MKYCFYILLFIGYSINLLSNEISEPGLYREQPFDVIEYQARVEFNDITTKHIDAETIIKIYWKDKTSGNSFYYNLENMTVSEVLYNNEPIDVQKGSVIDGDEFYKITPENIIEDTAYIKIKYSGTMVSEPGSNSWGGVFYMDSALFAIGAGMYCSSISTARYWLACYDHPSDKALYDFTFIVPKEYKVSSCGNLIEETLLDENKMQYHWKGNYPAATYMLAFHAGKYKIYNFDSNELESPVYVLESQTEAIESGFKLLPEMIQCFSNYYGEYPVEKAGYTVAPIGSMEHQTMITLAKAAISVGDTISSTVAHELSHQWFGGQVTPYDFRETWLNESFATFSEALWAEYLNGEEAYIDELSNHISIYFAALSIDGVIPIYNFPRGNGKSNYPPTIYFKGSSVVSMLRLYLGDEIFFKAIQNYLTKYKYSNATTQNLIDEFNSASNQDLAWFFDQWVFGRGFPQLIIKGNFSFYPNSTDLGKYSLQIEQVQNSNYGLYKEVPVEITFKKKSGETFSKLFTLNEKKQVFDIEDVEEIESISAYNFNIFRGLFKVNGITSDVYDKETADEIKINMTNDNLVIEGVNTEDISNISIYDYCGKKYFASNSYNEMINISNLPKGIYFIVLKVNDRKIVKQIII